MRLTLSGFLSRPRRTPKVKALGVKGMLVTYGTFSVDVDSTAFLDKVRWVAEQTEALTYRQVPYFNPIFEGETVVGHKMYVNVVFSSVGVDIGVDAVLLDRNPEVSVNEVRLAFGLPQLDPAPRFEVPIQGESPVGEPWPEKGSRVFKVSATFKEEDWPEGTLFKGRLLGRDVIWRRERVVIAVGSGPFGTGGKTAPSWGLVG